ncbi:MAG: hypothetical protein V2A54_05620 [Bacteroidota bacterium]
MIKRIIAAFSILFALTFLIIFNACKKEEADIDYQAAIDNAQAETIFNDIYKYVYYAASDTSLYFFKSGCPVLTISPAGATYPKTFTFDFGTGCLGTDSITRSGKIIANLTSAFIDPGCIATITLDNYHVISNNINYTVEGTTTIVNLNRNSQSKLHYSVEIPNGKITTATETYTWNSSRQYEWIQGEETGWPDVADDAWRVTGSNSGVDSHGNAYTINITSPLIVTMGCSWIVQGSLEISQDEKPTLSIDYGSGDYDNIASVTANGRSFTFEIN